MNVQSIEIPQLPQADMEPGQLTREQLVELLISFGNHELKAAQVLLMQPDQEYSAPQLQSALGR